MRFARMGLWASLIAAPGLALAFTAPNRLNVNPVDAAVFEVIGKPGSTGADYWCAAADYAQRKLRVPWKSELYIARTRGPSVTSGRKSAVHFTLDPGAAGISASGPSLSLNALRTGDHMSVQLAHTYCQQAVMRRF